MQRYSAAEHSNSASQRALGFIQKRYSLGLATTIEYLSVQNNTYTSKSQMLSAKYDLLFKLKVIDYYMGKELKL